MEARKMLATLTLDGGILTINGSNDRDVVIITQNDDGTFDVDDTTTTTQFTNDAVDRITFRGRNGDDDFINNSFEESYFYGHGGNDRFFGGVGVDRAWGGGGNDELRGGIGDDFLYGSDGDDTIYGEEGDDTVYGGQGADRVYGGVGDDFLSAEQGDDIMFGDEGNDFLRGFLGNDQLEGGDGNDLIYGQAGDDIIFGNFGNDRLRGNNDNDTIYGQGGDDVLIGDVGDDILHGGDNDDVAFGFTGDDILTGGDGNDKLYSGDDNDILEGGDGSDVLRSGGGDDVLNGGNGWDILNAESGNDLLYGGEGFDRLIGGDGDDSLHGGEGTHVDSIQGNAGSDRFLEGENDNIIDRVAEDVTIKFETASVSWNDMEVEVLDRAFRKIYSQTDSNVLLRETHDVNDDVTIYKYADLPGTITSQNVINGTTGKREIHIVDFDETTNLGQTFFENEILRQIGFNWDSAAELSTANPALGAQWQTFLDLSSWTQVDPQDVNFSLSGDGEWWYLTSTVFDSSAGTENPFEDFVGVWSSVMNATFSNGLLPKVNWLNGVFQNM